MVKKRKKAKSTKPAQSKRIHGEDWLDRLDAITIRLDSGEDAEFNIAAEVSIPRDATFAELRRLEATSAARVSFWGYQVARQRREVGKAARRLRKIEADADIVCRQYVGEHTDYAPTERAIQSHRDNQTDVKKARLDVEETEYALHVLEAIRDAVRTRSFVLGRLLNTEATRHEG